MTNKYLEKVAGILGRHSGSGWTRYKISPSKSVADVKNQIGRIETRIAKRPSSPELDARGEALLDIKDRVNKIYEAKVTGLSQRKEQVRKSLERSLKVPRKVEERHSAGGGGKRGKDLSPSNGKLKSQLSLKQALGQHREKQIEYDNKMYHHWFRKDLE